MKYDFDQIINRKNTGSTKWDNLTMRVSNADALPMWVADSDFSCAKPIVDAMMRRASHPIYGYTYVPEQFYEATVEWMRRHHGWNIRKDWIVFSPGIVPALNLAVQTLTQAGDEVIIQRPVYHPFSYVISENGRVISSNTLLYHKGRYEIDFEDLEKRAASPKAKLMLLCNPHNPTGRVWTKEELMKIGQICVNNKVIIVSDEIHADIVYPDHVHTVLSDLNPDWKKWIITCHAPSKTFNIAGLEASAIVVEDDVLRAQIVQAFTTAHINIPNAFAMDGYLAAYSQCDDYLEQQLTYLYRNVNYVATYLKKYMPKIYLVKPEATYLLWLDCSAMGLKGENLTKFFVENAALAINPGELFGPEGTYFVRMNIACPRKILEQAMMQLKMAYDEMENKN